MGANIVSPYAKSVWVQRAIKIISGPVSSVRLVFLDAAEGEQSGLEKGLKSNGPSRKCVRRRIWTSAGVWKSINGPGEPQELDLPAVRTWLEADEGAVLLGLRGGEHRVDEDGGMLLAAVG